MPYEVQKKQEKVTQITQKNLGKEPFLKIGFTLYKIEKPLKGMGLQEKEKEKEELHIGKLFRKNVKTLN